MTDAIELHDSTIERITTTPASVVVAFRPAIVHRFHDVSGSSSHTVWTIDADLTIFGGASPTISSKLPIWVMEGQLVAGDDVYDNTLPISLYIAASATFSFITNEGENIEIRGTGAELKLLGNESFLEDFDG